MAQSVGKVVPESDHVLHVGLTDAGGADAVVRALETFGEVRPLSAEECGTVKKPMVIPLRLKSSPKRALPAPRARVGPDGGCCCLSCRAFRGSGGGGANARRRSVAATAAAVVTAFLGSRLGVGCNVHAPWLLKQSEIGFQNLA